MPTLQESFGAVYDEYAGALDFASGSVDESIGRQFDDMPGGGFYDPPAEGTPDEQESVAGFDFWGSDQENPFLVGPAKGAYDAVFEYDETLNDEDDSVDLPGGNLVDTARGTEEFVSGQHDQQGLLTVAVGLVMIFVVAYLLRPFAEIAAALVGGE